MILYKNSALGFLHGPFFLGLTLVQNLKVIPFRRLIKCQFDIIIKNEA
jgi:hypothetical protein